MKRVLFAALTLGTIVPWAVAATGTRPAERPAGAARQPERYWPPAGDGWERKSPAAVGMDPARLAAAVAFARTLETDVPRDFSTQEQTFGRLLGPMPAERGGINGIVLRHGYIVAEFGDTGRPDPTYSAAKSFLSTCLGLALDRGLIRSVHDPVREYVDDGGYDSPQNRKVTWHHHAQQTSEWEGSMWGKSHDFVGKEEFGAGARAPRALREPGSFYEYNDVRINRFALSLLRVWKRPLPEVLKEAVMDPTGASDSWRYHGYRNSNVTIDGRSMPSVSGGTRWGGGLRISSRDEARFGLLFLRKGRWGDRQPVSERWVRMATTPGEVKPDYGYLWWLNTGRKTWPAAPESAFAAIGYGSNIIWIDPEHDMVVVLRWYRGSRFNEFLEQLLASVESRPAALGLAQDPMRRTRRIRFARGKSSATVKDAVVRGTRDRWLLRARAGQRLTARLGSLEKNAVFTIRAPRTGKPLPGAEEGKDATRWSGRLPATGDYVIEVGGTRGNATYELFVQVR